MDLLTAINHTSFLGREFLTWLWYRSDVNEGLFTQGEQQIEVWFDAKLVLEALGDLKEQNVIKAETPTETQEARTSLLNGKQVREARLRVISDQKQWTVTIKADDLSLSQMKIPALLSREEDDQLYERFYLVEELQDIIERLFSQFVAILLDDDAWRGEVAPIRDWVQRD